MSSTCPEPGGSRPRTRIIAHRGASGYLPEHTAVAKTLAYGFGADFIEQDLLATSDHEVVVLHDIYLDNVSNVASIYPERRRDDGHYYVLDFTLAELGDISLTERRRPGTDELQYPGRFPYDLDAFRILSFEDEIRLISGLNASTGGHTGLYPEIKDPGWHSENGIDLAALAQNLLSTNRELISGPVFIQSFDEVTLQRFRREFDTEFPLVRLLEADAATALEFDAVGREEIATYAAGVGLPFDLLIETAGNGTLAASNLALRLRDTGLEVHPYTMRRDVPIRGQLDYLETLRFLIHELEVDALFCDHPDDGIAVRDGRAA